MPALLHPQHPPLVQQAMILAAGLGTRLKPWTDHHPKALAVVNGKSLLQRNIEYLQGFGITRVVVNVHHFADQIVRAIKLNNGWGSEVSISDETNEILETGGGLLKAAPLLNTAPFILINADILTDADLFAMMNFHLQNQALATLATSDRLTSRYFLFDDSNRLCGWRNVNTGEEKGIPLPENQVKTPKAFSGLHIVDPSIFGLVQRRGKFSMVDVYLDLMTTHKILSFDHSGSRFVDVGKPESIKLAEALFH